jgi:hypothetical protein
MTERNRRRKFDAEIASISREGREFPDRALARLERWRATAAPGSAFGAWVIVFIAQLLREAGRVEEAAALSFDLRRPDLDPLAAVALAIELARADHALGHDERAFAHLREALVLPGLHPELSADLAAELCELAPEALGAAEDLRPWLEPVAHAYGMSPAPAGALELLAEIARIRSERRDAQQAFHRAAAAATTYDEVLAAVQLLPDAPWSDELQSQVVASQCAFEHLAKRMASSDLTQEQLRRALRRVRSHLLRRVLEQRWASRRGGADRGSATRRWS